MVNSTANNIQQTNTNVNSGTSTTNNTQNSQNNTEWQQYLENNYKIIGTRTNTQDIKLPIKQDEKTLLPKDPTKASSYIDDFEVEKLAKILEERPTTKEEKDGW